MTTVAFNEDCFGFHHANATVCKACAAERRCKSVLISNGITILGEFIEGLIDTLPENAGYKETQYMAEIVEQLVAPPPPGQSDEEDLLNELAKSKKTADVNLNDF